MPMQEIFCIRSAAIKAAILSASLVQGQGCALFRSKNFKRDIKAGVRLSWIEYRILSRLESVTTLAAIINNRNPSNADCVGSYPGKSFSLLGI